MDFAKGMVFYLDGDPGTARETLTELVEGILDLIDQSGDDSGLSSFVKRAKSQWGKFIQSASFESSEKFQTLRSTARDFRVGQLLMMGASPAPGCLNLPSFLYAEVPATVAEEQITSILVRAVESGQVFLALSDQVLADNPKDYPRSAAAAVKRIVNENLSVKRAEDTWLNPGFRVALSRDGVRIFDGPNRIIVVSTEHAQEHLKHLDWEALLPIWRQDIKTCLVIQAFSESDYRRLAGAITTSTFPLEKPKMFWKQDAWDQWKQRFLGSGT
nr:hypothetical protein [Rhodopirellula sp. SM50]